MVAAAPGVITVGESADEPLRLGARFGPEDELFELGEEIGSGAAARVYICTRVSSGEQLAAKVINLQRLRLLGDFEAHMEKLEREVQILQELKHPRIVRLHHVHRTPSSVFLVMELVRGGELFDRIVQSRCLNEVEAKYIFRQMLEGVAYMHSRHVIHRDLKPENILISSTRLADPPGAGSLHEVKIADFGLSKIISEESSWAKTFVGTPQYWAPEVLHVKAGGGSYTQAVDFWSLGAVLFVMLCGRYPFDGKRMPLEEQIRTASYNMSTAAWQRVSDEAKSMVRGLLVVDPAQRFNLERCLSHPWLAGGLCAAPRPATPMGLSRTASVMSSGPTAGAPRTVCAGAGPGAGAGVGGPTAREVSGSNVAASMAPPLVTQPSTTYSDNSTGSGSAQSPKLSHQDTATKSEPTSKQNSTGAGAQPIQEWDSRQAGGNCQGEARTGAEMPHESIFCLNELLKLQVSIAGSLEMAALAFRHTDVELAEAIRKTFRQARDLSNAAVKVVSQYAQVAQQVSNEVLPDLELAVQEKEPSLAHALLAMVKEWVGNMKNDGQEIQCAYHGLQESVHSLIQRAQRTKMGADRALAEALQADAAYMSHSPRGGSGSHFAIEDLNSADGCPSPPSLGPAGGGAAFNSAGVATPPASVEKPGMGEQAGGSSSSTSPGGATSAAAPALPTGGGGGGGGGGAAPEASLPAVGAAGAAVSFSPGASFTSAPSEGHGAADGAAGAGGVDHQRRGAPGTLGALNLPVTMNAWTHQLFEQLSKMQMPKAIQDRAAEPPAAKSSVGAHGDGGEGGTSASGKSRGAQFTNVDSEAWKRDVMDLLFMAPGAMPSQLLPRVESVSEVSESRKTSSCDADYNACGEGLGPTAAGPGGGAVGGGGGSDEIVVQYSPNVSASTAEALSASSASLLRALRELKRVDEILEGCFAFWANMDGTVQKLAQMKEHTDVLVNFASNSKPLRDRFDQRLGEYRNFWAALDRLCRQYCLDHQASAKRMYEVVREVSDAADVIDTANSARFGLMGAMCEKQRRQGY